MELPALAILAAAALAGAGATSTAAPDRAACRPKTVTVNGHIGEIECGPATAVVRFKGRTIRYKGGTCTRQGRSFSLYIGTKLHGGSSDHLFYLYFEQKPVKVYTPATALVGIQLRYASYHWNTGTLKLTADASSGTFTGKLVKFPQGAPSATFSGSYSCR